MSKHRVLVVDDNLELAETTADYLAHHGFEASAVAGGAQGIERFSSDPTDAILTDLRMSEVDGLDLLEAVKRIDPQTPVVIMTAFGGIDSAIEAIRRGAYHYVTKPFKMDIVRVILERACAERSLRTENQRLRVAVERRYSFANLVGQNPQMLQLYTLTERVAGVSSPALILGETGSGKELIARAIHANGSRAERPFVAVNCAALPEPLLESELFGHSRGAFTGATQHRRGLFLEADGGTLFLDEIGDMPVTLQGKLLRVLESGEVRPVGSDTTRKSDVRIVAATHRNLEDLVRGGQFREDLYFRLKVVTLRIPSLRNRRDDIPLLIQHFLGHIKDRVPASSLESFSPEAMRLLMGYPWPGNVRELENFVEGMVVTASSAVATEEQAKAALGPSLLEHPIDRARKDLLPLRELEQLYISWVLERTGGNKTRASEILGVDPSTLYRREVKATASEAASKKVQ
jgi:two-component system response regulator HydG